MNPGSGSMGGSLLDRLDAWNKKSKWLPDPAQWFPRKVFLGFLAWNFPILAFTIGLIGTLMYRSDPDPSGLGFFSSLSWPVELAIGALLMASAIDLAGCLWIRRLWNKRVRCIRSSRLTDLP